MLAAPLFSAPSFSPQRTSDQNFRPAIDIEAFNSLLPPPIEFLEGSSSGTLAVAEGKYEPINGSPKAQKVELRGTTSVPPTPSPSKKPPAPQGASLFTGVIDLTWPPDCDIGSGLINTGNSCFLNSALQCLLHTPPLLRVLSNHQKDKCRAKTGFCMTCGLREVAIRSHSGNYSFTPLAITNKLQAIAKHMRRGRQEDSHEFLRYAIDALQKACLTGSPPKIDPTLAETTWVHKIFGGRLRSRVTCRECNHNSDTFDSILDLSLDIYGVASLRDALRKFVTIDYLKGADKYKCEKCKKAVIAEKCFTIDKAPPVLTVHLKRFSPLGRKIGHFIKYDEHLSLQPAMSEGEFGPTYSLYGVICHAGGGPNSGHYFAHVKSKSGRWYEMNDEMVTPSRGPPVGMKSAYILFYIKERGQALRATVTQAPNRPAVVPKGLANSMKKRKATEGDDLEEDKGVKATRPFIGPVLPSPSPELNKRQKVDSSDPQANLVKKKIQAAKTNGALKSLCQYEDSDEEEKVAEERSDTVETKSSPPPQPPPTSSPLIPLSTPIPTASFYGASSNPKKRRSPDPSSDDEEKPQREDKRKAALLPSPKQFGNSLSKKQYGLNGPYSRIRGGNNLNSVSLGVPKTYSKSRKRSFMV
jgi:ubiquitin carboxyl-terminal hydrolase 36/42